MISLNTVLIVASSLSIGAIIGASFTDRQSDQGTPQGMPAVNGLTTFFVACFVLFLCVGTVAVRQLFF